MCPESLEGRGWVRNDNPGEPLRTRKSRIRIVGLTSAEENTVRKSKREGRERNPDAGEFSQTILSPGSGRAHNMKEGNWKGRVKKECASREGKDTGDSRVYELGGGQHCFSRDGRTRKSHGGNLNGEKSDVKTTQERGERNGPASSKKRS